MQTAATVALVLQLSGTLAAADRPELPGTTVCTPCEPKLGFNRA